MKKTRLLWFLFIFFLTGCQAIPVEETPFDYTYERMDNKVFITGYVGKIPKNIILPAKLEDSPIYGIKKDAFRLSLVETIQIPASIEIIEAGAFYATKLKSVQFHNQSQLKTIQSYAFAYTHLIEIELPATVETLGDYAFTHSTLEEIIFKDQSNLKTIGKYAFYNNVFLKFIEVPEGVLTIDDYAFYAAFSLDFAYIPSTVTKIGIDAFGYTRMLMRIEVSEDNAIYQDQSGVLMSKDGIRLIHYPSNHHERNYTLPNSVVYIQDRAFMGSRIESIAFTPDNSLKTIGNAAFKQTQLKGNVHLPYGLMVIQDEAFFTQGIKSIFVPETVTFIGEDVFDKFYIHNVFLGFKENSINKTNSMNFVLGSVYYQATYGETSQFSYIVFPTEVYIYEYVKFPVNYEITIPDTIGGIPVKRIMSDAFMNTFITKITIGKHVEVIHSRAFLNAEKLVDVSFVNGSEIKSINGFSFYGTDSLKNLVLPSGLTTIQFGAFMSTGLESIYIPNSVNNIGMNVFLDNPDLTIYTGLSSIPLTWDAGFNPDNAPVVFNHTP